MAFLRVLAHVFLLRPFVKVFFGVNIAGKENLRDLDRFIIVANHNSHLDICLLFHLLPFRAIARTHAAADKKYFARSRIVFRLVTFMFSPIWVTRGQPRAGIDPLGEMKAMIDAGRNIIIFPEGTRGAPGELQHFKSGIGRLVAQYPDLPIVPVFMSGPERALPKASVLPLPLWNNIIVGPPQICTGTHRDITESLENTITGLFHAETAHRHRRTPRKERAAPAIAFVGIDGSGKSSLSRKAAQELSVAASACLVSDRVEFYERGNPKEIQPLVTEQLREIIGGYAKKAQSLKLYKIPKLTELLLRNHLLGQVVRWYLPDVVVMDGSPLLNMAAWAVLYKKEKLSEETYAKAIAILAGESREISKRDPIFRKFPELLYLKRLKLATLKLPDLVVFLDVSPATACARIAARAERHQVHETEQKLGQLRDAYRMVCDVIQRHWRIPTITVDGEETLENVAAATLAFVNQSLDKREEDHGPSH